ncbi:hypothetical protein OHB26_38725 (plasmid) [Nocardia sp. NBC_01503]|uniref:hypothetical protein n=1 Tax=Nocardia sp. NBC_01503 TaxID=2975997 RepID=UPI002E7C3D8F|nr:hypothetical protein [Nocardia sp. NBC_01503]WTL36613.1 hypothetical protein OHB26_38725 [Nocardia sp. NBC_01503]
MAGRSAADDRAVMCSWAGTFTPFGTQIGPAVDSADRLARMLTYVADSGGLRTDGTLAQVWIVGAEALELLGWRVDEGDADDDTPMDVLRTECRDRITEAVARDQTALERGGWRLREGWETGGAWVRLERIDVNEKRGRARNASKGKPTSKFRVDVILEPYAWTTPSPSGEENLGILGDDAAGWGLVEIPDDVTDEQMRELEDAARAELGRRLCAAVEQLGVLPALTATRTGAAIAGKIWRQGTRRNAEIEANDFDVARSHVLSGPVPVPPLTYPPRGELEPAAVWSVEAIDPAELAESDRLVIVDQFGSFLGSFSVELPIGQPDVLSMADLDKALWFSDLPPEKWPVGLWAIMGPPLHELPDFGLLPPPHPEWGHQARLNPEINPVFTVTTETLKALAQTWTSGYGLQWCIENIALVEGWVWPASAPALAKFQTQVGEGYKHFVATGDRAMRKFTNKVYQGYQGALANSPEQWGQFRAQNSNPVAQANIHAHARWRIRRQDANAHARTGRRAAMVRTDALTFLVPPGMDVATFADPMPKKGPALGQLMVERWCVLTDESREALAAARGQERVAAAIAAAFANSPHVEVCK